MAIFSRVFYKFPDLNVFNKLYLCSLYRVMYPDKSRDGDKLAAASGSFYKWIAVCALRNSWVSFMSAYRNAAQWAVVFSNHVVLALGNGTLDVIILLLVFHCKYLLQERFFSRSLTLRNYWCSNKILLKDEKLRFLIIY